MNFLQIPKSQLKGNDTNVKDATLIFVVFKDCFKKRKCAMNIREKSNSATISFNSGEILEILSHFEILENDVANGFFYSKNSLVTNSSITQQ